MAILPIIPGTETAITAADKINSSNIAAIARLDALEAVELNAIAYSDLTVSVTYAELSALKSASELIPGIWYLETDHVTKHLLPNSSAFHTGTTEPILLLATSANTFSKRVYSPTYPTDYIEYDFDNNSCEDGTFNQSLNRYTGGTARNGFITRRIDTVRNNDFPNDFRNVKVRLYKLNPPTFIPSSPYTTSDNVLYDGNVYKCYSDDPGSLTPVSDYWFLVASSYDNDLYLSAGSTGYYVGMIPFDISDFIDVYQMHIPDQPTNSSGVVTSWAYAGYGLQNVKFEKTDKNFLDYDASFYGANYNLPNSVIIFNATNQQYASWYSNIRLDATSQNVVIGGLSTAIKNVNLEYCRSVYVRGIMDSNIKGFSGYTINQITNSNVSWISGGFATIQNVIGRNITTANGSPNIFNQTILPYNNDESGLTAENIQGAIAEIAGVTKTINEDYTANVTDSLLFIDASVNEVNITLDPTIIKKITIILTTEVSDVYYIRPTSGTISGNTELNITTQYTAVTIVSDGTNLFISS